MYVPESFQITDRESLNRLMRDYSFATLITQAEDRPFANHLPLNFDPTRGPHGTLNGHMVRANPQWRHFAAGGEALAIFQGPHAYVSPSWYVGERNVPTWNYATIHAYGTPRLIEDDATLRRHLTELVTTHEAAQPQPWSIDVLPSNYVAGMLKGIVGFEMPITTLQGKFKLNQNRAAEDRRGVIAALENRDDDLSREVAALMQEREPESAA